MANKLLSFLGLADSGDVVVESHRNKKRRTDYMKKIQRLVVPDDEEEAEVPTAAKEAAPAVMEVERSSAAVVKTVRENGESEKAAECENEGGAHAAEPSDSSFSSRLRRFGESLRRQDDAVPPLVLVKKGAAGMLDDIEDALVQGQTVMLDFEREDRKTASEVARRMADFVRMHDGAFYTVTSTSLLLSLNKNAVIEWLPEENGQEQ